MTNYIPNAWNTLETFEWDWFITATFPLPESDKRAEKAWRILMQQVARVYMSAKKSRKVGIPWIYGAEYHKSGGTHIHALVKGSNPAELKRTWEGLTGGILDVLPYDPKKNGFNYVVKKRQIDVSNYFKRT